MYVAPILPLAETDIGGFVPASSDMLSAYIAGQLQHISWLLWTLLGLGFVNLLVLVLLYPLLLLTIPLSAVATFYVYRDKANQYRWRLQANNNKIVADSAEGYHQQGGLPHWYRDRETRSADRTDQGSSLTFRGPRRRRNDLQGVRTLQHSARWRAHRQDPADRREFCSAVTGRTICHRYSTKIKTHRR